MSTTDALRALSASVLLAVLCIYGWCIWQLLLLIKDFGRLRKILEKDREILQDGICRHYREHKRHFGEPFKTGSEDDKAIRHILNLSLARERSRAGCSGSANNYD